MNKIVTFGMALLLGVSPTLTFAQTKAKAAKPAVAQAPAVEQKDAATLEFEKFRAEMEDSNPAELFEMKGEETWKEKRGPNKVSLAES